MARRGATETGFVALRGGSVKGFVQCSKLHFRVSKRGAAMNGTDAQTDRRTDGNFTPATDLCT